MSVLDTAKAHPYMTGGVVIAAIFVLVVVLNSGGDATPSQVPADNSIVGQGTAIQAAQIQGASEANQIQGQLQAMSIKASSEVALANIMAQSTDNANYLAYKAHSEDTAAAAAVTSLQSSLAAQVAKNQIDADLTVALGAQNTTLQMTAIKSNENIQTANILYATTVAVQQEETRRTDIAGAYAVQNTNAQGNWAYALALQNNAATADFLNINAARDIKIAEIGSQTNVAVANINSGVAINASNNSRPQSWIESIFG